MKVRLRESGNIVFIEEFRSIYNTTSFPSIITEEILNNFDADIVYDGVLPSCGENQYIKEDGSENINGKWFIKYIIEDYTDDEIKSKLEKWRQSASCTPFQGRVSLSEAGLLSQAEATVNNSDDKTKFAWEYALVWNRSSDMIKNLSVALGLTDTQIDDLFKKAQTIVA